MQGGQRRPAFVGASLANSSASVQATLSGHGITPQLVSKRHRQAFAHAQSLSTEDAPAPIAPLGLLRRSDNIARDAAIFANERRTKAASDLRVKQEEVGKEEAVG